MDCSYTDGQVWPAKAAEGLACRLLAGPYLNAETVRIGGGIRMQLT